MRQLRRLEKDFFHRATYRQACVYRDCPTHQDQRAYYVCVFSLPWHSTWSSSLRPNVDPSISLLRELVAQMIELSKPPPPSPLLSLSLARNLSRGQVRPGLLDPCPFPYHIECGIVLASCVEHLEK